MTKLRNRIMIKYYIYLIINLDIYYYKKVWFIAQLLPKRSLITAYKKRLYTIRPLKHKIKVNPKNNGFFIFLVMEGTIILIKDTSQDSHVHKILPIISEGFINSLKLIHREWIKNSCHREWKNYPYQKPRLIKVL